MRRSMLAVLAVAACLTGLPGVAAAPGSGTLVATEGVVQARTAGGSQWAPGRVRRLYAPGDALRTGRNARAEIAFLDGTITRLAAHSQLRLAGKPQSFGRLLLGKLWFKVTKQHAPIHIETPGAVASVMGTELLVSVDNQEGTHVTCLEGHVNVKGDVGDVVKLTAGQWTDVRKGAAPDAPTPFNWGKLKASEILLQPLNQDASAGMADGDPDDIWK
ncbi:MAG: FecR domain-containing protein [Candidatus Sericytochromatia bacterium]|nr:FecR domain-containing protein [Candidatus Sericytochromatia bacterium]